MPMFTGEGARDSGLSVAEQLLQQLRKHAANNKQPAQVDAHTGAEMTFRELLLQSVRAAEGYRVMGLARGDVVALFSRNYHEVFPAVIGAIMAGCTVSCCVPISNVSELQHSFSLCPPKLVLSEPDKLPTAMQAAPGVLHVSLSGTPPRGAMAFSEVLRRGAATNPDVDTYRPVAIPDRSDHVVCVLYSSGTTGLPKGVMLRDQGVSWFAANVETWSCGDDERFLSTSPMSWISGVMILLLCTIHGTTRVFMTNSDEYSILETIEKHKVNRWIGAPPILVSMTTAAKKKKYDLSSVKQVASGGAPLSAHVHTNCIQVLGFPIFQAYGCTEVGVVFDAEDLSKPQKPGSMGRLARGVTIKLVDPDTKKEITGPGQIGEVRVKSPAVMKGYSRNPKATTEAFDEEGYYLTGDLVYMDKDGDYFFVDRIKEMLKYKSLQIAPAEVESVLLGHPDVLDACVMGKYTEQDGDLVTAFIVRAPGSTLTARDLDELVASKLSDHKRLRGGVVFMDQLPRTVSGKTERKALRNVLKDMPVPALSVS